MNAVRSLRHIPVVIGLAAGLAACADENAPSASGAAAPTAAQESTARARCFRPDDVNGWRSVDSRTLNVGVGANRVFQMSLMTACPDINWTQRIGIQATGSSWICSGVNATIIAPTSIGRRRCPVTAIHELSPEEIAALPPRQRP